MRFATFLLVSLCLAVLLFGETFVQSSPPDLKPADLQQPPNLSGMGFQMLRRVEIEVVPLDLAVANRAELQSLRSRVAQAHTRSALLELSDPAVREQMLVQSQLMDSLLQYADRRDSDSGKSANAIAVQHRLNQIQGRLSCEACHAGVISRTWVPARMH